MSDNKLYDLAIVGGGLAGLSLSIQMARSGYEVLLLEKEEYPFHRVCGEYISMESWQFLESLGVDLKELQVSRISRLCIAGLNGQFFEQDLPLGGFGISRYKLDHTLQQIAIQVGVNLLDNTRADEIHFVQEQFIMATTQGVFKARVAVGSFGKRSNLDIKWKRPFATPKKNKLDNYIGVKYHVQGDFPVDSIALYIFNKGYCGLVKVEGNQYCLCYLTVAQNLSESQNDIKKMEERILSANPLLKEIFGRSKKIREEPVIISQISFEKKSLVEDHVLMSGDAAGMITPLCGNGMSMALHASKMAAGHITRYLQGTISRESMEKEYTASWNKLFASRLRAGRILQRLFHHNVFSNLLIIIGKRFPGLTRKLIKKTHGHPF